MTHLAISEYGYIYHHRPNNLNDKFIHKEVTQSQLKELIKYWQKDKNIRDALEYDGANLKAKNYVGVIQTQNISIEILPKIFDGNDMQSTRDIFVSMLKMVLNINELQQKAKKYNLIGTKSNSVKEAIQSAQLWKMVFLENHMLLISLILLLFQYSHDQLT